MDIDTTNKYGVSLKGEGVVIIHPAWREMTPDEALVLAAWLVAVAAPHTATPFATVLDAVENT